MKGGVPNESEILGRLCDELCRILDSTVSDTLSLSLPTMQRIVTEPGYNTLI